MAYHLALQVPDSPIKEEWTWLGDAMRSYDGSEDLIPLRRYPQRVFSGNYSFDRAQDVRRHMAFMFTSFGDVFKVPLYQYQVKLKAAVASGADTVVVNATRSDFRVGGLAFLVEGDVFEEVEVEAVAADSVTFTAPLENDYTARAQLCPIAVTYTNSGSGFNRKMQDGDAAASFRYVESEVFSPFVSPLNEEVVSTFDSMPVLDINSVGAEFEYGLETGIIPTDYLAMPDVFSPWTQSQWIFSLRWQVNRALDLNAWLAWVAFADHIQGAAVPFLLPTFREDLDIVTPASGSGNQVLVKGDEYSQHYWGLDTFARIVISSDAGRHYAKVTGIVAVGGNDRLTFTPALPAGAGWSENQTVGFLLKVRNADDKITCDHYGLHTDIMMTVRTVA